MRSIKYRIFITSFLLSSFIFILLSLFILFEAKRFIFSSLEDNLHSKVQLFLGLVHEEHNKLEFELEEIKGGEYSILGSGHYYIVDIEKENIIVSPSITDNSFKFEIFDIIKKNKKNEILFYSKGVMNEKVIVLEKSFIFKGHSVKITISESTKESDKILENIQNSVYIFTFLAISIFCLINYLLLLKLLKPLDSFTNEISNISHRNLNTEISIPSDIYEIKSLTKSFNNMLSKINKAFETEKFIISEASHQLKTPLAIIRSNCDITLKKERTIEEYKETLLDIKETSIDMTKKINDMLSLAKLDSESLKEETFEFNSLLDLVNKSVEISNPLAIKKNINISVFDIEPNIFIKSNFNELVEAFVNLVENAIKYSKKDSKINIYSKINDKNIEIYIQDFGIGIKSSDLSKIFDRFFRGNNVQEDGTGLGLPIVNLIVKLHQGNIKVLSEENKGSTFIISLPFQKM